MFLYFVNLVVLTFLPAFIVQGGSLFKNFYVVFMGIVGFILTQMAKLLFVATFVPEATQGLSFELLNGVTGIIDIIGIYVTLSMIYKSFNNDLQLAIGWTFGENLFTRFFPFWVGAMRASEFDVSFLIDAFDSNVCLGLNICLVLLMEMSFPKRTRVQLIRKNDVVPEKKTSPNTFLALAFFAAGVLPFVGNSVIWLYPSSNTKWIVLGCRAVIAGILLKVCLGLQQKRKRT